MRRLLPRHSDAPSPSAMSRRHDLLLVAAAILVAFGGVALVNVAAFDFARISAPPAPARQFAASRSRLFREDCLCGASARPVPTPLAMVSPSPGHPPAIALHPDLDTATIYRSRGSGESRAFLTDTAESARRPATSPVGAHKCLPVACEHGSSPPRDNATRS